MNLLIEKETDINAKGDSHLGFAPIHLVSPDKDVEMLKLLVVADATPWQTTGSFVDFLSIL